MSTSETTASDGSQANPVPVSSRTQKEDRIDSEDEQEADELRIELLELMAKLRSALQKWHAAYSRSTSGVAADLVRGQGRALALLAEHGEMPQRKMCEMLGIRPQSLGETLAKLERAGYIKRKLIDNDHRALAVRITESGRALIAQSRPDVILTSFSVDELRTFAGYLSRALQDIEERNRQLERRD